MDQPISNTLSRIKTSVSWGHVTWLWSLCYQLFEVLTMTLAEYFLSEENVDVARNFDTKLYINNTNGFGNMQFEIKGH